MRLISKNCTSHRCRLLFIVILLLFISRFIICRVLDVSATAITTTCHTLYTTTLYWGCRPIYNYYSNIIIRFCWRMRDAETLDVSSSLTKSINLIKL